MTSNHIEALHAVKLAIRGHGYVWPGGYPQFALMGGGETMSIAACKAEFRQIVQAHIAGDFRSDWYVQAIEVNWEDGDMICAHTNEPIPCAYPADDEA